MEVGHAGATRGAELRHLHRHRRLAGTSSGRRPPLHEQRGCAAGGADEAAHLPCDHRVGHRRDTRHGAHRLAGGLPQLARHALYGDTSALLQPAELALLRGAEPHDGARLPAVVSDQDPLHRPLLRHLPEGRVALEPVAQPRTALCGRCMGAGCAAPLRSPQPPTQAHTYAQIQTRAQTQSTPSPQPEPQPKPQPKPQPEPQPKLPTLTKAAMARARRRVC